MASVTSTQVVLDQAQADGRRYVKYRFDLLDNLNNNHVEYYGPKLVSADFDTDADMVALTPTILAGKAELEQLDLRESATDGEIVLHTDMGGFYAKRQFAWDTWDNHTGSFLKYFLETENQLDLVASSQDIALISNTDIRNLLGITNQNVSDIRADIQIAVDTQAALSAFIPFFVNGVWNRS